VDEKWEADEVVAKVLDKRRKFQDPTSQSRPHRPIANAIPPVRSRVPNMPFKPAPRWNEMSRPCDFCARAKPRLTHSRTEKPVGLARQAINYKILRSKNKGGNTCTPVENLLQEK